MLQEYYVKLWEMLGRGFSTPSKGLGRHVLPRRRKEELTFKRPTKTHPASGHEPSAPIICNLIGPLHKSAPASHFPVLWWDSDNQSNCLYTHASRHTISVPRVVPLQSVTHHTPLQKPLCSVVFRALVVEFRKLVSGRASNQANHVR